MKYPITPDYIKNAPNQIEQYYRMLEQWILQDICERFKLSDQATATALEHIRNLQRRGYSYKDIRKYIQQVLRLSDAQFDKIMDKAVQDNARYYSNTLDVPQLVNGIFNSLAMQEEINSIIAQCRGDLNNITQSLGFCVKQNGTVKYLPIAKAYQHILSQADIKINSGAQSYNEAIRDAVSQLAESGIRTVTWAKDGKTYHADHADVAARRAIMTGITQIAGKCSEAIAEDVPTPYYEVTAHSGARNVDVIGRPWANHKNWQGKVYSVDDNDKYPSIYKVCGLDLVDGLEGANCRHLRYPFWDGISERTYTDDELKSIDPPAFEFEGQTYDAYAATQKQRAIERKLREIKRKLIAYDAAGDTEKYQLEAISYNNYNQLYKDFCKAGKLRSQAERGNIAEFGPSDSKKALNALKQQNN